ncbi:unnamed protein product [Euphydryas editha]|uniref:Uncharacterized protein n=1 Tax=Euphydryas editha TaxID=104508 RepID=A0AAU9UCF8_EUPED|nr:unnamed protein product [Euphydryas editha]
MICRERFITPSQVTASTAVVIPPNSTSVATPVPSPVKISCPVDAPQVHCESPRIPQPIVSPTQVSNSQSSSVAQPAQPVLLRKS